jgi:RNA polymerase sigma factor (sigma-70 family)
VRLAPQDPDAGFDERFADLAGLAYRVAYRILGSREEARDIAQESLARAYGRWPRVRERAGPWVARVATNLALDHLRRGRRAGLPAPTAARAGLPAPTAARAGLPAPTAARAATPPAGAAANDHAALAAERADLAAALARLPRRQRDAVVLRHLADLSEAETAEALGCGVGTVKSHTHRGLAALRAALGTPGPGLPLSAARAATQNQGAR